ncbi:MAG: hypothetical protein QOI69_2740 [Pseudonocardiales bacterium]|nr:hypothetical protein [Pseudonocardiales bacterium]
MGPGVESEGIFLGLGVGHCRVGRVRRRGLWSRPSHAVASAVS